MKVYQINEVGFIEEEKELDVTDGDVLPHDFVGVEPPADLIKPRWVNNVWIEGEVSDESK